MLTPGRPQTLALRLLGAAVLLVGAAVIVRLAGEWLPAQIAVSLGLLVSVGLPGAALLRLAGLDERLMPASAIAAVPVLGFAAWVPGLLLALVAGLPLDAVLWALLVLAAVALAVAGPPRVVLGAEALGVGLAGLGTALLAARWATPVLTSDALFHAGRVRKLVELPHLSFDDLSAYQHGHVHAGYAFPLIHAAQAGAISLTGVDPSTGYLALVPACAFLVPAAAYAAGRVLGGPAAGVACVAFVLWDALSRAGGVLDSSQQSAGIVFRVVVPVCIALLVENARLRDERRAASALVAGVLVAVLAHPTYVFALLGMLTAVTIARRGGGWRTLLGAYGVAAVTLGLIWLAAIHGTGGAAATRLPPIGFMVADGHPVALHGDVVLDGRLPALLGLLAAPILLVAWRGTYGLAGAIGAGVLAVVAFPGVATALAPLIGPHQVGRLRGALPWPELLALALVLVVATWPRWVWPLVGGLAVASLTLSWLDTSAVAAQTLLVIAIAVAGVVLVLARVIAGRTVAFAVPPVVAMLPVLALTAAALAGPVVADGHATLWTLRHGGRATAAHPLSPGLVAFMRTHDGAPPPVVLAPLNNGKADDFTGLAFNLVGMATVDAVSLPEARTRSEPGNDPRQRRTDTAAFFDPATSDAERAAILQRYDVRYVVVDAPRTPQAAAVAAAAPGLHQVYADPPGRHDRYIVYGVER